MSEITDGPASHGRRSLDDGACLRASTSCGASVTAAPGRRPSWRSPRLAATARDHRLQGG
jgi:hypothetical protein